MRAYLERINKVNDELPVLEKELWGLSKKRKVEKVEAKKGLKSLKR